VGFSGSYIGELETSRQFRKELYIPSLFSREPYDTWEKEGRRLAIERARERALDILAKHQPRQVEPAVEGELLAFKEAVAARGLEEFYLYESEEKQDFAAI
jgi:trimethylamine--corrinoid protein Co-methyltransferase